MVSDTQRLNRRLRDVKVDIDAVLQSVNPVVRDIVNQLRQLVKTALPEARERPYPFFEKQVISYYYVPNDTYICFISFLDDEVRFAFEHGDKLGHPDLCDTGTFVRFLRLYQPSDINPEVLLDLLKANDEIVRTNPMS